MDVMKQTLLHPTEVAPLFRMYQEAKRIRSLPKATAELAFCYQMLERVSRSFALVIQQLPEQLRDPVCVFYLVLRALDTVEDDMRLATDRKVPLLLAFHERLVDRHFVLHDIGDGDYKELLERFGSVTAVFATLDTAHRAVIADITKRMGAGMAEFIDKDVETVADYDLYCHYVAGLVGVGLCHLFGTSGCEEVKFSSGAMDGLANEMGLFLQKTNIIRDYLEDINEEPAPRMFWPKEIWQRYGTKLEDFKEPQNRHAALSCLNHMIHDASRHATECLKYMAQLRNHEVFCFCAIPQIMAIATLQNCYNNGQVFEGVVKLRRGQTAKVFDTVRRSGMGALYQQFFYWGVRLHRDVKQQAALGDSQAAESAQRLEECLVACQTGTRALGLPMTPASKNITPSIVALVYLFYAINAAHVRAWLGMPQTQLSGIMDVLQPLAAVVLLLCNLCACW